ncbi:MAG: N-formylglutamate amidohydrolase [Pseudomonadota bacterium]
MSVDEAPGIWAIERPEGRALPILFDCPHSGEDYPSDFGSCQPIEALRPAGDALVDRLIAAAPDHGITVIRALFPRAYIDVNRAEDDLDPELLDGVWPTPLHPGPKSDLGIGLIRRLVTPGVPIYDRRLAVEEVRARIETYWRPYRARLRALIDETVQTHGRCVYLQWHSMKAVGNAATPDGPGVRRPDVVLGDRRSTTARPRFTGRLRNLFGDQGFRVRVNHPYAGADLLRVVGDPAHGVDAVQVELNRSLFIDEETVEPNRRFDETKARVEGVIAALAARPLP